MARLYCKYGIVRYRQYRDEGAEDPHAGGDGAGDYRRLGPDEPRLDELDELLELRTCAARVGKSEGG